jgi:CXXX repeat peptide maturase
MAREWLPFPLLKAALGYAATNGLTVSYVRGSAPLPAEYSELLSSAGATGISPAGGAEGGLYIVGPDDIGGGWPGPMPPGCNVIVRFRRDQLPELRACVKSLLESAAKVSVLPADLSLYNDGDLEAYRQTMHGMIAVVSAQHKAGKPVELNCLTDRIVLGQMNNCGAGTKHVTFAPDGRFYICPAFFYSSESFAVGDPEAGIAIPNPQLLRIENAPICSICDAYQCKRCIFLNWRLTGEVNTPSGNSA